MSITFRSGSMLSEKVPTSLFNVVSGASIAIAVQVIWFSPRVPAHTTIGSILPYLLAFPWVLSSLTSGFLSSSVEQARRVAEVRMAPVLGDDERKDVYREELRKVETRAERLLLSTLCLIVIGIISVGVVA